MNKTNPIQSEFWQSKTVFLTGHTGFKGSWLSLLLQHMGAHVVGYALPPETSPNLYTELALDTSMVSILADIRDLPTLQSAIIQHQPDIVIHMAAQPLVPYAYANPVETYETNVMGTANLLESIRQCDSVKAVVNVTTDKCYENKGWPWGYRETDTLGGIEPYANSKACAEMVSTAYYESYLKPQGIGLATARAGNVIGGGDWSANRLIPDIIKAIIANQPVQLRHPNAVRPWQHVLEPLHGYLQLAQKLWESPISYSGPWNFGPDTTQSKTVFEITQQLITQWGVDIAIDVEALPAFYEASTLRLDAAKAREQLQWTPWMITAVAVNWTMAWYRAFHNGTDIKAFTQQQIEQYQQPIYQRQKDLVHDNNNVIPFMSVL